MARKSSSGAGAGSAAAGSAGSGAASGAGNPGSKKRTPSRGKTVSSPSASAKSPKKFRLRNRDIGISERDPSEAEAFDPVTKLPIGRGFPSSLTPRSQMEKGNYPLSGPCTAREAAAFLGIDVSALGRYIKQERIPARWIGNQWLLDWKDVRIFDQKPRPRGNPNFVKG